jgi:glucose-1-phosphate thymidylyltransferase
LQKKLQERGGFMKGVILAGGSGTRLRPITKIINKHLLPVGPFPMIHYAMATMAAAGISDILLITGKQSAGLFMEYLGSGEGWGVSLTYRLQEEAGGIAQALALAEGFIQPEDKCMVLLGDNLIEDHLLPAAAYFSHLEQGNAMVFLKKVNDPRRYGVPEMRGDRIVAIEEKPTYPKSDYCVTGIYMYDYGVFEMIRSIQASERGELEITDVNNGYAAKGLLSYRMLEGWWTDAGTHQSLLEASIWLTERGKS